MRHTHDLEQTLIGHTVIKNEVASFTLPVREALLLIRTFCTAAQKLNEPLSKSKCSSRTGAVITQ